MFVHLEKTLIKIEFLDPAIPKRLMPRPSACSLERIFRHGGGQHLAGLAISQMLDTGVYSDTAAVVTVTSSVPVVACYVCPMI